mmetsp:Transcript_44336/g.147892  ORF Transcript_44336/g.147892 Transcript_44336/m.147892 type:complete len:231 (+) Transcript_44336:910-1602(+)
MSPPYWTLTFCSSTRSSSSSPSMRRSSSPTVSFSFLRALSTLCSPALASSAASSSFSLLSTAAAICASSFLTDSALLARLRFADATRSLSGITLSVSAFFSASASFMSAFLLFHSSLRRSYSPRSSSYCSHTFLPSQRSSSFRLAWYLFHRSTSAYSTSFCFSSSTRLFSSPAADCFMLLSSLSATMSASCCAHTSGPMARSVSLSSATGDMLEKAPTLSCGRNCSGLST